MLNILFVAAQVFRGYHCPPSIKSIRFRTAVKRVPWRWRKSHPPSSLDYIHVRNHGYILAKSLESVDRATAQRKRSLILTVSVVMPQGKRCKIPFAQFWSVSLYFYSRTRKWSKYWSSSKSNPATWKMWILQGICDDVLELWFLRKRLLRSPMLV